MRKGWVCFLSGITIAAICGAPAARASAWLEPPGQGEVIASTAFSDSTRAFDAKGRLIPIPSYQKFSLGTYVEYGLSNEFTLVAQPYFNSDRQATSPANHLTAGGTDLGLEAGVAKVGNIVISVQATAHIPFSTHEPIVDFDEDSIFAGDFRLMLGDSFVLAGLDSFADLEGSYRIETDDLPDEWHADATFGIRPLKRLLFLVQSFATVAAQATRLAPRYMWVKMQESLVYDITPRWSLEGGCFETVAGTEAGRELGPIAGVWYRF